jgi:hypothetical protein
MRILPRLNLSSRFLGFLALLIEANAFFAGAPQL